jgi:hypothetical protein
MSRETPELAASGIGGRVELHRDEVRIVRDGVLGVLADTLWLGNGSIEKRVPLADVTAMEIVRPMLLPSFFRVSYAGSPPQTGHYLTDALAENALIMNLFDHRAFYELQDRVLAARRGSVQSDADASPGAAAEAPVRAHAAAVRFPPAVEAGRPDPAVF